MPFPEAIRTALLKYATFEGVAHRSEFWWFALFIALGHAALNTLNIFTPDGTVYLGSSLSGLFGVAMLLPLLTVSVRRLRDAGRNWTELFWLLLPVAGLIVLIVHLCDPTRPQPAALTDAPAATPTKV
ncbi:MAG: DUF805 domain-containing protein [Pseudolysinimonas sp.]